MKERGQWDPHELQEFLDLPAVKYLPWFAGVVVIGAVILAIVVDSSIFRIVLLVAAGLVVLSAPFAIRQLRDLREGQGHE